MNSGSPCAAAMLPGAEPHREREWHLDKRVPITLIGALLVQTMAVGWWARGIEAQVHANVADIQTQFRRLNEQRGEFHNADVRQRDRLRVAEHKTSEIDKHVSAMRVAIENIQRDVSRLLEIQDRKRADNNHRGGLPQ